MGKGDKKTKRGKIVIGSSGVSRARKKKRSKSGMVHKVESKPNDILEHNPTVQIPEISPMLEQVEEKVTKKPAVKKAAPKKPVEKVVEGESKPKPAKSKKKAAKPAEDLFTEKKEGTE